jgi:hypothetical protein
MRGLSRFVLFIVLLGAFACKKANDPNNETEHEAVNAVDLKFFQEGVLVATFTAEDPDGDGGESPSRVDKILLKERASYTVEVVLRNIVSGTSKDISDVIRQQGKEHEFYFIPSGVNLDVKKTDKDAYGFPLGFMSNWVVGIPKATGTIKLKLMHKPRIKGPADDPSKGHSDLSIDFPVEIQ